MDVQAALNKPIPNANVNRGNSTQNKNHFEEFVAKETRKEISGKLTDLMNGIEKQGNKLNQSQSIDNLKKYKKQVKEFMNYVKKNAIKLEHNEEFNSFGYSKPMQMIKKTDEKLIELTDQLLQKEENSGLRVLELIGEIKGLLVDVMV